MPPTPVASISQTVFLSNPTCSLVSSQVIPGCSREQTTDEPVPSLHTHYKRFVTTTNWSASAAATVLNASQFLLLDALPLRSAPATAGNRPSIGSRLLAFHTEAQIRLTPPA